MIKRRANMPSFLQTVRLFSVWFSFSTLISSSKSSKNSHTLADTNRHHHIDVLKKSDHFKVAVSEILQERFQHKKSSAESSTIVDEILNLSPRRRLESSDYQPTVLEVETNQLFMGNQSSASEVEIEPEDLSLISSATSEETLKSSEKVAEISETSDSSFTSFPEDSFGSSVAESMISLLQIQSDRPLPTWSSLQQSKISSKSNPSPQDMEKATLFAGFAALPPKPAAASLPPKPAAASLPPKPPAPVKPPASALPPKPAAAELPPKPAAAALPPKTAAEAPAPKTTTTTPAAAASKPITPASSTAAALKTQSVPKTAPAGAVSKTTTGAAPASKIAAAGAVSKPTTGAAVTGAAAQTSTVAKTGTLAKKTTTGTAPKTGTAAAPKTVTGAAPKTTTVAAPKTATGAAPKTGTVPKTGTGTVPKTTTGATPKTSTGMVKKTTTGSLPKKVTTAGPKIDAEEQTDDSNGENGDVSAQEQEQEITQSEEPEITEEIPNEDQESIQPASQDGEEEKQEEGPQMEQFTALIPDGAMPGDSFTVQIGEQTISLMVPEGGMAGDAITFEVPVEKKTTQTVQYTVLIPDGALPGDTFTVQIGDNTIALSVPDDKIAGDAITFEVEVPAEDQGEAPESVPEPAPEPASEEALISEAPEITSDVASVPLEDLPLDVDQSSSVESEIETETSSVEQEDPSQAKFATYTVLIPDGAVPGDIFTVAIGDDVVSLSVPEGGFPGEPLTFQVPIESEEPDNSQEQPAEQSPPESIFDRNEINMEAATTFNFEEAEHTTGKTVTYTALIPDGALPGDTFTVPVGENSIALVVPDDKIPGDMITFEVPVEEQETKTDEREQDEPTAEEPNKDAQAANQPQTKTATYTAVIPDGALPGDIFTVPVGENSVSLQVPDDKIPGDLITFEVPLETEESDMAAKPEELAERTEELQADPTPLETEDMQANTETYTVLIPDEAGPGDVFTVPIGEGVTLTVPWDKTGGDTMTFELPVEGQESELTEENTEQTPENMPVNNEDLPKESGISVTSELELEDTETDKTQESGMSVTSELELEDTETDNTQATTETYTVLIPEGAGPGDVFTVPIGEGVSLTVPWDKAGGDTMTFELPHEEQETPKQTLNEGVPTENEPVRAETSADGPSVNSTPTLRNDPELFEPQTVTYTVLIPEGAMPGDMFSVPLDDGDVTLTVPDDKMGGETMTFDVPMDKKQATNEQEELAQNPSDDLTSEESSTTIKDQDASEPATVTYTAIIPDGALAGDTFTVPVGDQEVALTVPTDKMGGDYMTFEVAVDKAEELNETGPVKDNKFSEELVDVSIQESEPVEESKETTVETYTVLIPEGAEPGDSFTVPIGDQVISLTVPFDKMGGDVMTFEIPSEEVQEPMSLEAEDITTVETTNPMAEKVVSTILNFEEEEKNINEEMNETYTALIPEGAMPGDMFSVPMGDEDVILTVPSDKSAGDTMTFQYPVKKEEQFNPSSESSLVSDNEIPRDVEVVVVEEQPSSPLEPVDSLTDESEQQVDPSNDTTPVAESTTPSTDIMTDAVEAGSSPTTVSPPAEEAEQDEDAPVRMFPDVTDPMEWFTTFIKSRDPVEKSPNNDPMLWLIQFLKSKDPPEQLITEVDVPTIAAGLQIDQEDVPKVVAALDSLDNPMEWLEQFWDLQRPKTQENSTKDSVSKDRDTDSATGSILESDNDSAPGSSLEKEPLYAEGNMTEEAGSNEENITEEAVSDQGIANETVSDEGDANLLSNSNLEADDLYPEDPMEWLNQYWRASRPPETPMEWFQHFLQEKEPQDLQIDVPKPIEGHSIDTPVQNQLTEDGNQEKEPQDLQLDVPTPADEPVQNQITEDDNQDAKENAIEKAGFEILPQNVMPTAIPVASVASDTTSAEHVAVAAVAVVAQPSDSEYENTTETLEAVSYVEPIAVVSASSLDSEPAVVAAVAKESAPQTEESFEATASDPVPNAPDLTAEEEEYEELTVEIPEGLSPGMELSFEVGDMVVSLTIPEGSKPGDALSFSIPKPKPLPQQQEENDQNANFLGLSQKQLPTWKSMQDSMISLKSLGGSQDLTVPTWKSVQQLLLNMQTEEDFQETSDELPAIENDSKDKVSSDGDSALADEKIDSVVPDNSSNLENESEPTASSGMLSDDETADKIDELVQNISIASEEKKMTEFDKRFPEEMNEDLMSNEKSSAKTSLSENDMVIDEKNIKNQENEKPESLSKLRSANAPETVHEETQLRGIRSSYKEDKQTQPLLQGSSVLIVPLAVLSLVILSIILSSYSERRQRAKFNSIKSSQTENFGLDTTWDIGTYYGTA